MVKFNWTVDDIRSRYELLIKMQKEEKDSYRARLIAQDIHELYDFLINRDFPEVDDMPSLLDKYNLDKRELAPRKYLWGDIRLFRDEVFDSIYPAPDLKRTSLSRKDIMDLTHDFFKTYADKFYFHNFLRHYRDRYSHILFTPEIPYKGYKNCMGENQSILTFGESFISVLRNYNIEDVLTTIHEYTHATSIGINPLHSIGPNSAFAEIDAPFMEMLAADYLESIFKNGEALLARAGTHEIQCNRADVITLKMDLINAEDAYYNGEYQDNKMLKESAARHLGMSSEETDDLIQEGSTSCNYSIGYLFAIELYHLYQSDREKALDILKRIINLDCQTEEEYYNRLKRMGLVPNYNLREFHNGINESIRSLKKKD